ALLLQGGERVLDDGRYQMLHRLRASRAPPRAARRLLASTGSKLRQCACPWVGGQKTYPVLQCPVTAARGPKEEVSCRCSATGSTERSPTSRARRAASAPLVRSGWWSTAPASSSARGGRIGWRR